MKLIVSQSDLKNAVRMVAQAIPNKPTHPILGNVLLRADKNKLELTGFDLSIGIQTSIDCQLIEQGEITLPCKTFSDIISLLEEGEITIEYSPDDHEDYSVNITSSTGKFTIQGMKAEDFPELRGVNGTRHEVNVKTFLSGIKTTLFSSSQDETKQVLTGVNIKYDRQFTFASTDGHRLTTWESEIDEDVEEGESFSVTVKSSHLKEVEKTFLTNDDEATMTVVFDHSTISFSNDRHLVVGRILDGAYPAYEQLIPKQFAGRITVDRKKLISSIERVSVLCDQKNNVVQIHIDPEEQTLTTSTSTREVGTGREFLSAQISNQGKLRIGFNIKYLLEGLKTLSSTEVDISFNQENTPVIISPLGGDKITYLIMPVQIRE